MESLLLDIVQEILSWVPAESVLECKLVCKKWVTLIRESSFANMHLSHQINHLHDGDDGNDTLAARVEPCLFLACRIDDPTAYKTLLFHGGQPSDRVSIGEKYIYNENLKRIYHPPMHEEPLTDHLVGCCNGLVCTFKLHDLVIDPIYICNPLTREYAHLPELVPKKEEVDPDVLELFGEFEMFNNTACGFGYVSSTNEYKVVRIHYLKYTEGEVEVYTLGSGCGWRVVGTVSYRLCTTRGGRGTYANDAIYWTSGKEIVAFDLVKEEFQLLPVPPRMQKRRYDDICGLVVLGRHLCLYIDDQLRVGIWSLMKSSDTKEAWRREFDIDYEALIGDYKVLKPILLTKAGEVILLYAESVLYSYDPKTTVLEMLSNEPSTDHIVAVDAIAHVNTFASLEAMGEPSKIYKVRPRVIEELDRVSLGEEIDTTCLELRS